jgi:hypothetical protein
MWYHRLVNIHVKLLMVYRQRDCVLTAQLEFHLWHYLCFCKF